MTASDTAAPQGAPLTDAALAESLGPRLAALRAEIGRAVIGQQAVVDQLLIALLCRGHALLVGVPGLAKTLLIQTLAQAIGLRFSRIQFTPDLMPSDILGTEILEAEAESGRRYFKFVQGPIFANVVLADEINRTPPKTQSALLEAMQEGRATVAGQTYALPAPFFVLATQNPIEQEGTYPLPEAQLDRFMFNLFVDYPSLAEEVAIVKATTSGAPPQIAPQLTADELAAFQGLVRRVPVADGVVEYAVQLAARTRRGTPGGLGELVSWGAGPRASQYLVLGAKAHALLRGKLSPDREDVRAVALPVLRHRIVPSFAAEADGVGPDELVRRLLA